jgi:hypothetical protein
MTTRRYGRIAILVMAVLLGVGACRGSAGTANDPQGVVKAAMDAVSTGGLTKFTDYVCAAKKNDLTSLFGQSGLGSLSSAGIDPTAFMNAMSIKVTNLATTEKARTDTTATVHVTGDTAVTFDKAKMRDLMKAVLAAQGKPTDDATLDLVMNAMSSQLTMTQKLDEDVTVVNEGGKWLICE